MERQKKRFQKKPVLKVTKIVIKTTNTGGHINAPGQECGPSPL